MKDVFKKVAVKVITILIILLLLAGGIYFAFNYFSENGLNIFGHKTESGIEIVKAKLEAAAELNTGTYLCTVVLTKSDSREIKQWNLEIPLTEKSFTIQYDGTVKAGIKDLTKADVTQNGNLITVKLPNVEITGSDLDNKSFKLIDESNNIFNPINTEDINSAQQELKDTMIKKAKEKGILKVAKTNAEAVIKAMLGSADGEYEIKVEWK